MSHAANHAISGKDIGVALLAGVLGGVLGLAPWLATGLRLPLQNLWAAEVPPEAMPLSLLPLNQYKLVTLVALLTVGGAAAGLAVRLLFPPGRWSPARRRLLAWCAAAGVLLVQLIATVQAFAVLRNGLVDSDAASDLYFGGLLAGVIAAVAAGLVACLLLAAASPAVVALGVGLMAVPFENWLTSWASNAALVAQLQPVLGLTRWVPAVLVGLALAWCGLRPPVRLLVWAADLVLLWVVPALFISVQYVLGTRVRLGDVPEMLLMSRQILAATLGPAGGGGLSVLVAVAIGLAGAGALEVLRRRKVRQAA
jgi:hypothetical protein